MSINNKAFVLFILFCLVTGGLAFYFLKESLARDEKKVEEQVENTSFLIAEWIKGAFEASDYILRDMVYTVPVSELYFPAKDLQSHARITSYIDDKRKTVPNSNGVGLNDKDCIVTHTLSIVGFDASQREWCSVPQNNPDIQTYVSNMFTSNNGELMVIQSRKFPGDSFTGLAGIGVNLHFFSQWLNDVSIGENGIIAISDMNLSLLARKPALPQVLGKTVNDPDVEALIESDDNYMSIRKASPLDGINRVYSIRQVNGLPFVIIVGEADRDWMFDWEQRRNVTIFSVFIAWILAFFVYRTYLKNTSLMQREVELVKQYNDEQKQLLAMLTHEIRTPISVIDAAIESLNLLDGQGGDQYQNRLRRYDRIRKAAMRMNGILEMGLSQMDKQRLPFEPKNTDIQSLTYDVIELAESDTSSSITLDEIDESLVARVDARLLKIAMLNLLDNAIKYTPAGSNIRISCYLLARDGVEGISWSVYDQGPGVAEDEQDKIFQKGFRGSGAGQSAGLGLGLHLVKRIVERHQGDWTMNNLPEGGSVFTIWIPL